MTKKDRAALVCEELNKEYGTDLKCYLHYDPDKPWQLLIATILSAQCTDERVNMVTPDLFEKYPTLEALADAELKELEEVIHSVGFFHNKAKNIKLCAGALLENFGGELPSDIDDLTSLPGVGRKTANVARGNIYGIESVVVDTHVKRISRLLGLTNEKDPVKIEFDLMKVLPKHQWTLYNHQIIAHGRRVCISGRPRCSECCLRELCKSYRSN